MEKIKVFCYGDSNTYGYDPSNGLRFSPDERWTGLLRKKLGSRYEVIEQGCNGRTTVFPEPGAEWKSGLYALKVSLNTYKPVEIMILMLGTNDLKTYFGASAEAIARGAEILVKEAKEFMTEKCGRAPAIILVSPIELGEGVTDGPFGYEFDRNSVLNSRRLASLYKDAADRQNVFYLNAADYAKASPDDCVHMEAEEHKKLAEALYEAVTKASLYRSIEDSGLALAAMADTYVSARRDIAKELQALNSNAQDDPQNDKQKAALKAALSRVRESFYKAVTDAERDFRVIAEKNPPLKGSFFDLMTEVRTTPENASESLRDFLDRSLKML